MMMTYYCLTCLEKESLTMREKTFKLHKVKLLALVACQRSTVTRTMITNSNVMFISMDYIQYSSLFTSVALNFYHN